MATISDARAIYGLQATGAHTSTSVSGSIQIGTAQTQVRFPTADVAYSLRAIFAGNGDVLAIDMTDCDTTGSTAFVAGNAQVETATITAASGATSSGTMTMVLTSAAVVGSPLNIAVPLVTGTHTTAALIATAARNALLANAAVIARFSIGGTGANIVLTSLPTSTHAVPTGTLNLYAANDPTLNLAIPAGLGVTLAAASANTTLGVISDGVKIYDGDGKDFEGDVIQAIGAISGILLTSSLGSAVDVTGATTEFTIGGGDSILFANAGEISIPSPLTLTSSAIISSDITLTVIGTTV